jgi:hypothetical protein
MPLSPSERSDTLVMIALVVSFAALVTAHVAVVAGLAVREPRWRALVALAVPPLAPFWAIQSQCFVRSAAWVASAAAYAALWWLSGR